MRMEFKYFSCNNEKKECGDVKSHSEALYFATLNVKAILDILIFTKIFPRLDVFMCATINKYLHSGSTAE